MAGESFADECRKKLKEYRETMPGQPVPMLIVAPYDFLEEVVHDPESIHDHGWFKTHRDNPSRSPAWRWMRAGMIARRSVPKFRDWDDNLVRDALDFRRGIESEDVEAQAEAAAKWPAFHAALEIYKEGGPTQWELEARVLASEAHSAIATKIGVPVEVVDSYTRLFYDVKDRLQCMSIVHVRYIDSHKPCYDLRTLWAYYGYTDGPYAVDALVDALHPLRGTAPCFDHRMQSQMSDAEVTSHMTWLTRQLSVSGKKNVRHLIALNILQTELDRVRRTFVAPRPGVEEVQAQFDIGRAALDAEIARSTYPLCAPLSVAT